MTITVHLHVSEKRVTQHIVKVLSDDTLSDLKKVVVASVGGASCAAELYAWQTLNLDAATSIEYIVDVAMESGGSNLIGPRIVTQGHLRTVTNMLTGLATVGKDRERDDLLTIIEATEVVRVILGSGVAITRPLGVVHELGSVPHVMIADPFKAPLVVDPFMASQQGDLRDVFKTTTEADVMTLATLFKHGHDVHMACASDVDARFTKKEDRLPLRAGFLRKYFPLRDAWRRSAGDDHAAESKAFAMSRRAVAEVLERMYESRKSRVERCVLSSIVIHFNETAAHTQVSLDQSAGLDMLSKIFSRFRVTRDVPVIRYHDGQTAVYKVSRVAVTSNRTDVTDYLARCTRAAIAAASINTRVQKRPTLNFLVALPSTSSETATVQIKQDLNYVITRTFSTSSTNGGGAFADVLLAQNFVNRRVMQPVWTIVQETGQKTRTSVSASVVIHEGLQSWEDLDALGSVQAIGSTFTITLTSGRVPKLQEIRTVVERMFPFFVPVTTPGDGTTTLFLQYRRVDRFEHTDGLLQTLRLLRDESIDVITQKVARAFGLSLDEASRRIDAELKNGKVPYIHDLLRSGVSVQMTHSIRGILCRVTGASSASQHRKILRLLTLAVDTALKGAKLLEWVDEEAIDLEDGGKAETKRRYLEDWEEEHDEQDDAEEMEEIDALLEAELGSQESSSSHDSFQTSVAGTLQEATGEDDQVFGNTSHDAILREIQRSDPALFHFRKSGYSTWCGKVDGRQPIVVTKGELSDLPEGSHTGAIAYGTTIEAAERNRFICPDVWCPRSRKSMSLAQFASSNKRCPLDDELPIVSDSKYFMGKGRFPGFLKPSKHPEGLCMPCCFRLPRQRFGICSATEHPGFFGKEEDGVDDRDKDREDDPRYLRNHRAPLDDGRFGLLPPLMVDLLGGTQRCGGREDGSGQMNLQTHCFVRRGTPRHSQTLISSMVWMLDNPECKDIKSFVALIERHLTPDVFVTLNDGRMAQVLMREVTASSDQAPRSRGDQAKFAAWFVSDAAETYVRASRLGDVLSEAKALLHASSSEASSISSLSPQSLDFQRECLLFSAMQRFIDVLRDASMIKGHTHLLDLCSRPLAWLNPKSVNFLMFESNDDEENVSFLCPYDGGLLERHLRLSDPFQLLFRKGLSYHPVVRVGMSRRDGIHEQKLFYYDSDRFLHQTVYRLLEGCRPKVAHPDDPLASLLTGLTVLGETAREQVLDYKLRLIGIMTTKNLYIALPSWTTPLIGSASIGIGTIYVADAMRLAAPDSKDDIIDKLGKVTGVTYTSPREGGLLLGHLGVFVGRPREDTRMKESRKTASDRTCRDKLVKRFRAAIWSDAASASELVFLRHGLNPLPPSTRSELMAELVERLLNKGSEGQCMTIRARGLFVEHMLFASDPLAHTRLTVPVTQGSLSLTDVDLMSSSLSSLLRRGISSFDGPTTGVEPVPVIGAHRDVRSRTTSGSGSGSLVSMMKSLFFLPGKAASSASASASSSISHQHASVISGTRMLRCHPWRALSVAQQLLHTELQLPMGAPLMMMKNHFIDRSLKRRSNPEDPGYLPSEEDIRVLSKGFGVPVRLIEQDKVISFSTTRSTEKDGVILVLAWFMPGAWYVVLADNNRMLWTESAANKIQARIQRGQRR